MSRRGPLALRFATDHWSGDVGAVVVARETALFAGGFGVLVGVARGSTVVGAHDAHRVLVGSGISGIGDVALARGVGDQEEDEAADQQDGEDGGDDISHTSWLPSAMAA